MPYLEAHLITKVIICADFHVFIQSGLISSVAAAIVNKLRTWLIIYCFDLDAESSQHLIVVTSIVDIDTVLIRFTVLA